MRRVLFRFLLCMVAVVALSALTMHGYGLIAGHEMSEAASFAVGMVIGVGGPVAATPWWTGGLQ